MNYFAARRAEKRFTEYRNLAVVYWDAIEEPEPTGWAALDRQRPASSETPQSIPLRHEIMAMEHEVQLLARQLGVPTVVTSYPAPMVGGPITSVDVLGRVVDRTAGHHKLSKGEILDVIHRCIGAANLHKRRAGARLIKPWYWLLANAEMRPRPNV